MSLRLFSICPEYALRLRKRPGGSGSWQATRPPNVHPANRRVYSFVVPMHAFNKQRRFLWWLGTCLEPFLKRGHRAGRLRNRGIGTTFNA
jgi:hypothetical protein